MLRDALLRVASEFAAARRAAPTPGSHPLAQYIRGAAANEVRAALGDLAQSLVTKGSPGAGNWAAVPWLAVFDPLVTTSAKRHYYVVYLFSADGRQVHLSLNQGTTAVREELKSQAPEMLRNRADLMRQRLHTTQVTSRRTTSALDRQPSSQETTRLVMPSACPMT